MKKILATALSLAMLFSLASCGKKDPAGNNTPGNGNPAVSGRAGTADDSSAAAKLISFTVENGDIIFTLSGSIKLETDGWIGICPNGNYVYEDDADNAGLTYDFFEERDSESDPYVFKVAYEGLEDGSYTMVLCDTDNSGYVMASWPLTIKDGKPAVDLSHFSLNPEPAGMPPKQSPAETVDPDGEDIDDDYDEGPAMTDFDEEPDDGADDA